VIDKPTESKRGVSGSSLSYYYSTKLLHDINITNFSDTNICDVLWRIVDDNVTGHLSAAISHNMRVHVTNSITNSIRNNVYVECRGYWI
jgi:hypothetical protein